MNSSSAFSNILPATSAQPKTSLPLQRNTADDTLKPQETFKTVLGNANATHETNAKEDVPGRKLAANDKQPKAKAVDNGPASADKSVEKKSKKLDSQTTDETKESTNKPEVKDAATDSTAINTAETVQTVVAAQIPIGTEAAPAITDLPQPIIATEDGTAISALDGTSTEKVAADAKLPETAVENPSVTAPPSETLLPTPEATVLATAPTTATPVDSTTDSTDAASASLDPVSARSGPAMMTSTSPVTDATAAATAVVAPEVLAAEGITSLKNTDTGTQSSVPPAAPASATDDSAAVTTTSDPKLVFEKMLQAMASNGGANNSAGGNSADTQDKTYAPALASANSSTTAASVMDSSLRGSDSQVPAARGFIVQTAVQVPVGQPQWSQAVGEKVLWLAAQNVQSAEIQLNPPELGPMQVKVSLHQEQASVSFTSHNAGVREILDQNVGRLRDMFNEQGLGLVNVDVSDRSFQRQQGEGGNAQGQGGKAEPEDEEATVAVSRIVQQRLVDHYA